MGKERDEFLRAVYKFNNIDDGVVEDLTKYKKYKVQEVPIGGNNAKKISSSEPKRYTSKTSVKNKKKKSHVKTLIRGAITLTLAGAIALTVNGLYQDYQDKQNTISLSQSLSIGNTLEDLGLNEDMEKTLYELEGRSGREDTTQKEKEEIINKTLNLAFNVIKSKIVHAANKAKLSDKLISPSDITLVISKNVASVRIKGIGTFKGEDLLNVVFRGERVAPEIKNFIETIASMQEKIKDFSGGKIDYDELPNICGRYLKDISKFAAAKVTITDNKINYETQRVSEYKREQAEKNEATQKNIEDSATKADDDFER